MGISGGPNAIQEGLVLSLDASDRNSYDFRENLVTYTSLIGVSGSAYGSAGYNLSAIQSGSVTLTASIAPDGTNTATLISQSVSNDYLFGFNTLPSSLVTSSIYTYSIFAKQGTKSDFTFTLDENGFGGKRYQFTHTFANNALSSGTSGAANNGFIVSSGSADAGNGWRRIWGTFQTSTGSVSGFVDMIARFGSTGGTTYVWGRQLEKKSFPTPYTATTDTNISASAVWVDLSANRTNGAIQSASFSNNGGGGLFFNGVTCSVAVNSTALQDSGGTINTWVYPVASPTSAGYIFSAFGTNSNRFYITQFVNAISATRGNPTVTVNFINSIIYNQWYNLTATWVSSSLSSSLSTYLNGVFIGSNSYTASGTTSTFAIGGFINSGGSQAFSGSIAITQIYNRPLSATEVQQNYNALKTRFGLT
jgi:hypothetical protein